MAAKYCHLNFLFNYYAEKRPFEFADIFKRRGPIIVEIGFGLGEFLLKQIKARPEANFIGLEQDWERIYKATRRLEAAGEQTFYNRVKILMVDAVLAFERFFPRESIDEIYSLFPCPWPKRGHEKYRLFSQDFLKRVNASLKNGGKLRIVTDFKPYVEWVQKEAAQTGFAIEAQTIDPRYDTKFERKWVAGGQKHFYEINFEKKKDIALALKGEEELKAYRVSDFDPEKFIFENYKEEISVIFKDMLYDSSAQRALVYLVVAEHGLTQNIWVKIYKDAQWWRIAKGDGQQFIPTFGVAKAIELVYQAVSNSSKENTQSVKT